MLLDGGEKERRDELSSENHSVPAAITDTGCERELNED
ncbi:MAG: hypothetical protein RL417_1975, partial [Pseudomonadota bacterium]